MHEESLRDGKPESPVITLMTGDNALGGPDWQKSHLEYAAVYDQAPVMMYLLDEARRIVRVNQAVVEFTGKPAAELVGMGMEDLFKATAADENGRAAGLGHLRTAIQNTLLTGKSHRRVEIKPNVKADREITLLVSTALIEVSRLVLVCMEEITQLKHAEEQVREQAALLDIAQDAVVLHDLNGRIQFWNRGAENLFGWKVEEALGMQIDRLLFRPNSMEFTHARQKVLQEDEWSGELHQLTNHKTEIIVQSRWALVRNRQGSPKSIMYVGTDITERKKMEAQFLRTQRLEILGTLASGIAHDLNNVLSPILMSVAVLSELNQSKESKALLSTLEASAQRGSDIVRQLLSFGRGLSGSRLLLLPQHLVREMVKIAQETFPKAIEIKAHYGDSHWQVLGDATQLHQVLLNLCINARDAMPKGGKLFLTLENMHLDDCFAQMNPETKPGQYVVLTVSDTGTGIPPEIMDKIFDPFFTTKAPGSGTGLGLATVANIVKAHGGFVQVNSELGKGTQFKVYLPATVAEHSRSVRVQPTPLPQGQGELVLLIDDEAAIRQITRRTLESNGYQVIAAQDGAEAMVLYVQERGRIKVVIIDMMMPHMDGSATIRVLRKLDPGLPIIAVSGMMANLRDTELRDVPLAACLDKPFTADTLLRTLQEVLSPSRQA